MEKLLFTSESVTEGHPDKICDAISDAILLKPGRLTDDERNVMKSHTTKGCEILNFLKDLLH